MSGSNHIAGGIVFTGVFLSMYDINIFSSPTFIFFTGFFSLLADADHTKSFIGKIIYPVAKFIYRKYGDSVRILCCAALNSKPNSSFLLPIHKLRNSCGSVNTK